MLRLRLKAPFAAFRTFSAGSYRPSMPFLPPSAAYGLLMGVAGIETRYDDGKSTMTLMKSAADLPAVRIALGAVSEPSVQTLYQQLHNYPVGNTGQERAGDCKGAKYNIQPIRREVLVDLDAVVLLDAPDEVEEQFRRGLCGEMPHPYGLPFVGDNNLLPDVLREESSDSPTPARWWRTLRPQEFGDPEVRRSRLTVWIDRADMTRTVANAYTLEPTPRIEPTDALAWTQLPPRPKGSAS